MSEKQTKNTKEILSNVWNWEHTEDGGRRAVPNPHPVIKKEKMLQEIQEAILKKIYPDLNISEAIFKYGCINEVKYSDEWGSVCIFSLSRVLSALGEGFGCIDGFIWNMKKPVNLCKRKLITDTGSDAMLDDQSDNTIEALHKLLVRK